MGVTQFQVTLHQPRKFVALTGQRTRGPAQIMLRTFGQPAHNAHARKFSFQLA